MGRPYDHSRDHEILVITLDALAENDYEHMTLDAIALRAKRAKTTLYRRWPSKVDLVVAAVQAVGRPPEADALPDEGSLRDDLLAVIDSPWLGGPERRASIFAGLMGAARSSAQLADTVRTTVTEPYAQLYLSLLCRALEQGRVAPAMRPKLPLLAQVIPAMSDHRLGVTRQVAGRAFYVAVVDDVLLPALQHQNG